MVCLSHVIFLILTGFLFKCIAKLLSNSKFSSVRPFVRYFIPLIIYIVYNLLGPSVYRSCYKRPMKLKKVLWFFYFLILYNTGYLFYNFIRWSLHPQIHPQFLFSITYGCCQSLFFCSLHLILQFKNITPSPLLILDERTDVCSISIIVLIHSGYPVLHPPLVVEELGGWQGGRPQDGSQPGHHIWCGKETEKEVVDWLPVLEPETPQLLGV